MRELSLLLALRGTLLKLRIALKCFLQALQMKNSLTADRSWKPASFFRLAPSRGNWYFCAAMVALLCGFREPR